MNTGNRLHRMSVPSFKGNSDGMVEATEVDRMRRLMQDEFNRLASDFYDFKQATIDAAILPLKGVSNIAITTSQYGMSATWELPQQDTIEPTHVRVRILEVSPNDFAEYSYPLTGWEFNGLLPGTQYTLQVQIVARFETTDTFTSTSRNCPSVPVLRTAESDIKAKVFFTDEGVGPPEDNGTDDTNVIFTFPDTDGDPGAVDSSDCWWDYKIQYRTACAWADTAVTSVEVAGDVGDVTVDTGTTPFTTYPDTMFRLGYREICDGVAGDYTYGEPFMAVDFSEADCLGISKSDSTFEVPYSAADIYQLPAVCQEDGTWMQIVDGISDTEFTRGTGLKCVEYIDNEWTLIGVDTAATAPRWQPMITGSIPAIGSFNNVTDFSMAFDIKQPSAFNTAGAPLTSYPIIDVGGQIKAYYVGNATDYSMVVQVPRDGGGVYSLRADNLVYGEWNAIYYLHDVSNPDGRILYVNGVEVDRSDDTAGENNFDAITSTVSINTVTSTEIRRAYFWDENVAVPPPTPTSVFYDTGTPTNQISAVLIIPSDQLGQTVTVGDDFTIRITGNPNGSTYSVVMAAEPDLLQTKVLWAFTDQATEGPTADYLTPTSGGTSTIESDDVVTTWGPGSSGSECVEIVGTVAQVPAGVNEWPAAIGDTTYVEGDNVASVALGGTSFLTRDIIGSARVATDPDATPPFFFDGSVNPWSV